MKTKTNFLRLIWALVIPMLIWSCGSTEEPESAENDAVVDDIIHISQEQFDAAKLEIGKLEQKDFSTQIRVNGLLDVPPQNRAIINVYFGGYVKKIDLLPGDKVAKGDLLFVLENPDYLEIQQQYLESKGQLDYLESNFLRQKELIKDSITSKKNLLQAESEFLMIKAKYESLRKKVILMNLNPDQLNAENITSQIQIKAPISGYVSRISLSLGSYVSPSEKAMTIVDTEHMHLELKVFEKDLEDIQVGQLITFTTQEQSKHIHNAEVHLINKVVDAEDRSIQVHGHIMEEESSDHLFPGMYIEANIYTLKDSALALPDDAIVELNQQYFVLTIKSNSEGNYAFEQKEVLLGLKSDGYSEITNAKDFEPNTSFLMKGAFNLIQEK